MAHHIIRTADELEALDPDTIIETADGELMAAPFESQWSDLFVPAVVLVPGEQARAARKALEDA